MSETGCWPTGSGVIREEGPEGHVAAERAALDVIRRMKSGDLYRPVIVDLTNEPKRNVSEDRRPPPQVAPG